MGLVRVGEILVRIITDVKRPKIGNVNKEMDMVNCVLRFASSVQAQYDTSLKQHKSKTKL